MGSGRCLVEEVEVEVEVELELEEEVGACAAKLSLWSPGVVK